MYSDCDCIQCMCKSIKQDMEENYLLNRDTIIEKLYRYFSKPFEIVSKNSILQSEKLIAKTDIQKFESSREKLRNIQQMIENGDAKTDILIELEILETTVRFLQKYSENKQIAKLGKGNVKYVV